MIFLLRELRKLPQVDININLATANLSNSNNGLTSMIMNAQLHVDVIYLF